MKNKNWGYLKLFLTLASIIGFVISFWFWPRINLGFSLLILFAIGAGIYKWGEDSTERKLESFKTWTSIHIEEKKERLSEINDKLEEINNEDYDFTKDDDVSHSKEELIKEFKEEKKITDDRIKELEKVFVDADEDIPE